MKPAKRKIEADGTPRLESNISDLLQRMEFMEFESYAFVTSSYIVEKIFFGGNFGDGLTRLEDTFLAVGLWVRAFVSCQGNSKTNYSRNTKLGILHLYVDATWNFSWKLDK